MAGYPNLALLIDGQWCSSASGTTLPVMNPATEEVIDNLPVAEISDWKRAVAAAQRSFRDWAERAPAQRATIMRAAADLVRKRVDCIAATMMQEQGKDIRDAKREVLLAAEKIEFLCEVLRKEELCRESYDALRP